MIHGHDLLLPHHRFTRHAAVPAAPARNNYYYGRSAAQVKPHDNAGSPALRAPIRTMRQNPAASNMPVVPT
jgi:hypothetical protein